MAEAHGDQAQAGEALVEATVAFIARSIVSDPETVSITTTPGERALRIRLEVEPADLGRLIGRAGRTARAIRGVVRAAATKAGVHVNLEIAGRGEPERQRPDEVDTRPAASSADE